MDTIENENMNMDRNDTDCWFCTVKDWICDTVYEGTQFLREHRKSVLTVSAIVVAVIGIIGGLGALFGKKK